MRAVVRGAVDALRSVDPWCVAAALALYGGEACRIAAIGLRSRVPVPAATVSAVYDRLSEVPPVAGLMLCAVPRPLPWGCGSATPWSRY